MEDARAASGSRREQEGDSSMWKDRMSRAIVGLGIGLGVLTLAGMPLVGSAVAFHETQPLVALPWFLPVAQSFVILSGLAIAFLSAGRYLALGGPWVFWGGAIFLVNAVLSTFYLLSWPGLLGDHGLIALSSNTASWLFCMTFSFLVLLLPVLRLRPEGRTRSVRSVYSGYGVVALLAALIGVLSVSFEEALPLMVSGGSFTSLNLAWVGTLSALMGVGAALGYRRYRREGDPIFGYLSLFLVLMAFGLLYSIMGGKRYDPWWYAARALYDIAYITMLFGILQEGYALFGRERERAKEREKLLAAEQQARGIAEKAVRARDELISIAAHELKTPVTSLQGFAQLILRQAARSGGDLDPEMVLRSARHIEDQSRRLTKLTEQLLDLSRLETGKLALIRQENELSGLVRDLVATIQQSYPDRTIDVLGAEEVVVCADALRLEQVISNLIDNALKFSPPESPIKVELSLDGAGWARIGIRDYGVGIPEARRARLFERFYQAHTERHYGGMGIGLSISRQIVEMHGGTITLEEPKGAGSLFVVSLPAGPCGEAG